MKVFFATLGSVGDVKPCLHLGLGMHRLGHEVLILANDGYRDMVEGYGLRFLSLSSTQDQAVSRSSDLDDPKHGLETVQGALFAAISPLLDAVREHHVPGESVWVAPTRVLGARLAQEAHGIPLVSLHMAPLYLTTFDGFPGDAAEEVLGAGLDSIRFLMGLPPREQELLEWQFSPDLVVGLFPEWFAPPAADWPERTQCLDFPLTPKHSGPGQAVRRFIDAGEPPLVFSPGTYTQRTEDFFQRATQICETLGRRAILTPVPQAETVVASGDVLRAPWIDFPIVLPRTAALIHAGGIGACAEALRAGIPQCMIPRVFDQRDNAERIQKLGAGVLLGADEFKTDAALRAIDRATDDETLRAARELQEKVVYRLDLYERFSRLLEGVIEEKA